MARAHNRELRPYGNRVTPPPPPYPQEECCLDEGSRYTGGEGHRATGSCRGRLLRERQAPRVSFGLCLHSGSISDVLCHLIYETELGGGGKEMNPVFKLILSAHARSPPRQRASRTISTHGVSVFLHSLSFMVPLSQGRFHYPSLHRYKI